MNKNKVLRTHKSLDGDCLFLDETTGEVFYSSPDQDLLTPITIIVTISCLMPVLMALAFKLGGM